MHRHLKCECNTVQRNNFEETVVTSCNVRPGADELSLAARPLGNRLRGTGSRVGLRCRRPLSSRLRDIGSRVGLRCRTLQRAV